MNESSGVNCCSDGFCSCWNICICSADAGSLEVCEVSAASGTSGYGTIYLACFPDHSSGNTTLLHYANSSASSAPDTMSGSGLTAGYQYNLSPLLHPLAGCSTLLPVLVPAKPRRTF
jgi:hypothetical protein